MVREIRFDEIDLPRGELERILHTKTLRPPPLVSSKRAKQKRASLTQAAPPVERHISGRKKYMG